jgi:hypothetical protein
VTPAPLPADTIDWLLERVLLPAYVARSLLVPRCPYGWSSWAEPTCSPTPPPAAAAELDWPMDVGAELSEQHQAVLEFEARWWRRPGAKEQAIRDEFGISAVRYYQLVNRLVDAPAAAVYDPALIGRLRRLRARRRF